MNQTRPDEPDYFIASVPGVWNWAFNLCLFASGLFSDLLLIKLCLTLGFSFMLVHAIKLSLFHLCPLFLNDSFLVHIWRLAPWRW